MTKPIPDGAERKRPARSCVSCRASKLRCTAVPLAADGDGLAQTPCGRCAKNGLDCHFVSLRRKGRPRRILKPEPVKDEFEEELVEGDDWSGDEDELVGAPNGWKAGPTAVAHLDRPDPDLAALAQGYISDVHPFLPILSNDLNTLVPYLRSASQHLALAVATLVYPRAPLELEVSQLGTSVADIQAGIFLVYSSYGRSDHIKARKTLRWVGMQVVANGWERVDSPLAPARDPRERDHIRRIFFEVWGLEVVLAMQTGVRAFTLQGCAFEVDTADLQQDGSPYNLKVRALSLVAAASEPPSTTSPSLSSIASICTSIGLLGHQAYLASTNLIEREEAFSATMLSSAALIHVVAASYASSGFTCGLDPTLTPTRESREMINTSSNMIFATLRESLRPDGPRTLHSPFWGCALLAASHGLLLSLNSEGIDPGPPSGDVGMLEEGDEWRRSAVVSHLELADWVLTEHKTRWRSVERVHEDVKTLRNVFLGDMPSEGARLLMSSYPPSE